ncbi:MAG TPA: penicillin-binding protein 2 [Mycobacteriales bacterium]|nr:penicillin-binding protein 2 [Mycobacteriales bacterium]
MLIALALAGLGARLVWLQGISATAYAAQAEKQRLRTTTVAATRGKILDRNGRVLAQDVDARAVYVDPKLVSNAPAEAAALAPVVGAPKVRLAALMTKPERFVYLAHGLTPAQGRVVAAMRMPGVGVLPETRRTYPGGPLAANVVGFTNSDGIGLAGIEHSQQNLLMGAPGKETVEVDPGGREIPGGLRRVVPAHPGENVVLTLDADIQWEAQQAIAAQVAATHSRSGTVIVLDAKNGQVLADATAPSFDAANPGAGNPSDTGNRTITDSYEPGSVNKVIVAAAALQTGALKPDDVLAIPPTLKVADATFHDAEAHGAERLTFTGVLAKSSNIGAIEIAQRLGNATVDEFLKRFGFGVPTGIGLPGESAGVLPPVDSWRPTTAATIPFGQGMDVTSMQVAAAYQAVANDGVYIAPRVVAGTSDAAGHLVAAPAPTTRRVIDASTAQTLRTMIEQVTTDNGTAPEARIPGYRVAGKTGTAQAVGANGRYDGGYISSFVGMAPAEAPRLVVEVSLDHPTGGYFGGTVAAPVFRDVMGFALQTLRVPPSLTPAPVMRLLG